MGTWTHAPFSIYWAEGAVGWYETPGWQRDLFGIYQWQGWYWVTHLPTGYRLYESMDRRSAMQFIRFVEGLTDWGAITVEGEKDPLLVQTVEEMRERASIWPGKVMQLDIEYDGVLA